MLAVLFVLHDLFNVLRNIKFRSEPDFHISTKMLVFSILAAISGVCANVNERAKNYCNKFADGE